MSHFNIAYKILAHFENFDGEDGGEHTEPLGGYTRFGIAQSRWPEVDVRNLTAAEARAFYRQEFWGRYRVDRLEHRQVAVPMFLAYVNMSPRAPGRALQRACRATISASGASLDHPEVDGIVGPLTAACANALDGIALASALRSEIVHEYEVLYWSNPSKYEWALGGWTRRGYLDGIPRELRVELNNGSPPRPVDPETRTIEADPGEPGSEED